MTPNNIPHLCGGILFGLINEAKKNRRKSKDKLKGGTDGLTIADIYAGLISVVTGEDLSAYSGNTLRKCATNYRKCEDSTGDYVPFTKQSTQSAFDALYKKNSPDLLNRMIEFTETYLNTDKCEWLVRAIIDTMQQEQLDISIAVSYTESLHVDDLHTADCIYFFPFILNVLHYVVVNCPDCESGKETFLNWYSQSKPNAEWKFASNIGDNLDPISISFEKLKSENDDGISKITHIIVDPEKAVVPDLAEYQDGILYMQGIKRDLDEYVSPFKNYLDKAVSYYSTKKTLLYAEKPHPFYELYVCNDVTYQKYRVTGAKDTKSEITISNATVEKLEAESKYIIIEGIGGIGKSMFLTHLFLSSAEQYELSGTIPLFLSLKNYKDTTDNVVDFIWKSICEYDPEISRKVIIEALQNKELVLLLDGYDEIQSSARESFQSDLEAFIKSYSGNTIIMTSRPIYDSFVSFSKFSVFDIKALTKSQALALVDKLEFWDDIAKNNFMKALDNKLYSSHWEFASNPLLLTIMLMTYSAFGEVPAKMHVFYSKAYETMARLHDASKGSFKRPLHTNLTPEEFSKYFAEFCARTYRDEMLEFDERSFTAYMNKVLHGKAAEGKGITPHDFLLDLTDNLCIMYREGSTYYFIHRSFQEYFAAVHFSSEYDAKLTRIGNFFEGMKNRTYTDKTFDMMYDMIPDKVERFIFLPFLEKLLTGYSQKGEDEYWEFLEDQYPYLNYEEGETGECYLLSPQSFLYKTITKFKKMNYSFDVDSVEWPIQIYDLPTQNWVRVYSEFAEDDGFAKYPDPTDIDESLLEETILIPEEQLPYQYDHYFGTPDSSGLLIEIEIYELRRFAYKYREIRKCMEESNFPLMREYREVKEYYKKLKEKTEKEDASDDLFDD